MGAAVEVFKVNAIERLRLEAEAEEAKVRAAAQRKADMHRLANEFQAAVGNIIQTFRRPRPNSRRGGDADADRAYDAGAFGSRGGILHAGVLERAVRGVRTEELGSSVNEISRQVQESNKIAVDASSRPNEPTAASISCRTRPAASAKW